MQTPQAAKQQTRELEHVKLVFALEFWSKYQQYKPEEVYNADETALYYGMFPNRVWSVKGSAGSARVGDFHRHPGRMTAVLTIRADGTFPWFDLFLNEICEF